MVRFDSVDKFLIRECVPDEVCFKPTARCVIDSMILEQLAPPVTQHEWDHCALDEMSVGKYYDTLNL